MVTEKERVLTFPLIVRVATEDGWNRVVKYDNPLPVVEAPTEVFNASGMASMLQKYVDKDGDLEGMELFHFLNWAWNFDRLPAAAKEGAGVEVEILMQDDLRS